jgi:phage shock protein A
MFDKLRDAFREAVDNFKEELGRDEIPETVDRLLRGMKNEAADAQARVRRLEQEVELAQEISRRESRDATTCRRREEMATKIGDAETAQLAAQYAEKHEKKQRVMEEKADALRKELALARAEVTEMIAKIKQAQKDRDTLAATAGRSEARESIRGASDLFDELDRMAEKIDDERSGAQASEEMWREMEREEKEEPVDFDARLEQLKRRMSED